MHKFRKEQKNVWLLVVALLLFLQIDASKIFQDHEAKNGLSWDGDEAECLQQAANRDFQGTDEQRLKVLQAVIEQLPYLNECFGKADNVENAVPRSLAIEEEKTDFKFRFQGKIPSNQDEFMNAVKTKVASTLPNAKVPQIEIKAGNNVEKYHKGYCWKQTYAVPTFYLNFKSSRKSVAEMIQDHVKEHQLTLPQKKYYLVQDPCEICFNSIDIGAEHEQRLFSCNPLHMCCKQCVARIPNQRCHYCREPITVKRRVREDVWKALQETVFLPFKLRSSFLAAFHQVRFILHNIDSMEYGVDYTLKDVLLLIGRYALIPELLIMVLNFSLGPITSGWPYFLWMFVGIYANNFIKGLTSQRIFLNDVQLFIFLNQGARLPNLPFIGDRLTGVGDIQNEIIIGTAAFFIATLFRKVHQFRWVKFIWGLIVISHFMYNHWTSKLLGIGIWEYLQVHHGNDPFLPYGTIGFNEETPINIVGLGFALFMLYLFKKTL